MYFVHSPTYNIGTIFHFTSTTTRVKAMPDNVPFADQVNEAVTKLVETNGVWEFPADVLKDLPEAVAYSAKQEKRIRDNSSAFHKANNRAKELEAINGRLTTHLVDNATLHLSSEQRTELEELKLTDPDAWRTKLTSYETEAKTILQAKVNEFQQEGKTLTELDERKIKLAAFTESTKIELTDKIIEEQLPASYAKQLAEGKITFDDFLDKAHKFLTKEKVIKGANEGKLEDNNIDLSKLPGGNTPDKPAQEKDLEKAYKKTIF